LSALTASRTLRTASFEFDIGFLLEVYFARRQRFPASASKLASHKLNRSS
jgi:hypothetical protein